ncbi:MAG: transporter substrate-binding domain-containing protein, partial [Actinomycetia bacterium]|nr:transporter substrate-binding domain-containing protein [Actinomycetes bacterium]
MNRLTLSIAALLAAAVAVTGCSSGSGGKPGSGSGSAPATGAAQVDQTIRAMVPQQFIDAGYLDGGANFQAPPLAMYEADGKTPTGAMVTLVEHAAGLMGLTVKWQQLAFADQVPAMQAGKIVVSGSASAANAASFAASNEIGVFYNNESILVPVDKASSYNETNDVCGKNLAV